MSKSAPFGQVERALAWRYLRARRQHGGVSLISIISFFGIMLAVMALIVIMSVTVIMSIVSAITVFCRKMPRTDWPILQISKFCLKF